MSKPTPPKRKVVVTTSEKESAAQAKPKTYRTTSDNKSQPQQLVFARENYYWILLGAGLVVAGLFLMTGGHMPSPDVWDDSIIYSWRRTVLAPFLIFAGLAVEIFAIFKRY